MELIAANIDLTPKEKELANECRMWLRIITISDIADLNGQSIKIRRLKGFWRATPAIDLRWPQLPTPTKRHCSAFRQCLLTTVCSSASPYDQSSNYKLDTTLGPWFIKPRHVLHECYRSNIAVYWRDDHGYHKCNPSNQQNIYTINRDSIVDPPLLSHLVSYQSLPEGRLWV